MKTILISIISLLLVGALISFIPKLTTGKMVEEFDFGSKKAGPDWKVMNDGVMGGLSSGSYSLTENSLILEGEISLANNGGFSSVRGPWGKMDISKFTDIEVRYRSEGQTVAVCLEPNRQWFFPYYLIDLRPTDGEWTSLTAPLLSANENSMAKPTGKQLRESMLSAILRVGFMTNDKKESPFRFEVDYVKFK